MCKGFRKVEKTCWVVLLNVQTWGGAGRRKKHGGHGVSFGVPGCLKQIFCNRNGTIFLVYTNIWCEKTSIQRTSPKRVWWFHTGLFLFLCKPQFEAKADVFCQNQLQNSNACVFAKSKSKWYQMTMFLLEPRPIYHRNIFLAELIDCFTWFEFDRPNVRSSI